MSEADCECNLCKKPLLTTEPIFEPACHHKVHSNCIIGSFIENGFHINCKVCNVDFISEDLIDHHVEERRLRDREEVQSKEKLYKELEQTDKHFKKELKALKSCIRGMSGSYRRMTKQMNGIRKQYFQEIAPFLDGILHIRQRYHKQASELEIWKELAKYKRKRTGILTKMNLTWPSVENYSLFRYIGKLRYNVGHYNFSKSYIFYKTFRHIHLKL